MNYRIGIFGFAAAKALRDAKSENIGLRDQYAAMEWVRDNIADFGGDPARITLWGQSFGAISVGLQMVAYGGKRPALFEKAIMASGAISANRSDQFAVQNTAVVAEGLGCTAAGGVVDDHALECLRKTPRARLLKEQLDQATKVKPPFGFAAFSAVVDGDVIPDQPFKLLQAGRFLRSS
jgi:carboxylesterase type B